MADLPNSFEFAKEVTTQLLTLATAVVSISVTFVKDVSPSVTRAARGTLYTSWILFLVSIIFGVWVLGAMTGTLAQTPSSQATVYSTNIRVPSFLQVISFVAGIAFLVLHAARSRRT
jgi:hypothetical protein